MISSQDFDRLSAYLDNQLSPKEKAALETRLAREPELKATLDGLRQTVSALRSLPVVKPPRNFTLSARQVGAVGQVQRRFFPGLRLATSLAALALVLVFAGDFFASRTPALSPAAPLQNTTAERSMVLSEVAPPAAAVGAVPAPTLAPAPSMDQGPAGAGAATEAVTTSGAARSSAPPTPAPEADTPMAAAVLAASPVTTDSTAAAAAGAAPSGGGPLTSPEAPVPVPSDEQSAVSNVQSTAVAKQAASQVPEPTSPATSEPAAAAKLAPTQAPASTETWALPEAPTVDVYQAQAPEPATAPGSAPGLPWRAVEISLLGLTLILGAVTWLMRRR